MIAMIVILLILIVWLLILWTKYKRIKDKNKGEGFYHGGSSNLATHGNHNLWWHGAGDAGNWGTLHREATPWHVGHYDPDVRIRTQPWLYGGNTKSAVLSGACGAAPGPKWDPSATIEAQALAQVGSLQHDDFGEYKLQSAVDQAFDVTPNPPYKETRLAYPNPPNKNLSDAQLAMVMHQGGAP